MKLYEKMRQQKLLSTTLLLVTLSIGIVIGTLFNTGVNAARGQNAAPDATPLVIPRATAVGNEFTKLAKILDPSVVNITADFTQKVGQGHAKGRRKIRTKTTTIPPICSAASSRDPRTIPRKPFAGSNPARASSSTKTATSSPTITWWMGWIIFA